jgi:hypothetical protein
MRIMDRVMLSYLDDSGYLNYTEKGWNWFPARATETMNAFFPLSTDGENPAPRVKMSQADYQFKIWWK